jgi:hypothetical protein
MADNIHLMKTGLITPQEFVQAQQQDPELAELHERAKDQRDTKYYYDKAVLCKKRSRQRQPRPVLPEQLFKHILYSSHYNITSGHRSVNQIVAKVKDVYHVQDLEKKVKQFSDKCYYCQTFKARRKKNPPLLQNPPAPEPRHAWSVDYAFGLTSKTKDGDKEEQNKDQYTGVLVMVDHVSLYTILAPVKTKSAEEFIRVLEDRLVAPFGAPDLIRSDRESAIRSAEVMDYFQSHGIQHSPTAGSAPFSNGKVEIIIEKIKTIMAMAFCQSGRKDWRSTLASVSMAHNHCPLMFTQTAEGTLTPEQIMFGNQLPDRSAPVTMTMDKGNTPEEYAEYMQNTCREIRDKAADRMNKGQQKRNKSANQGKIEKSFKKDDVVLLKDTEIKTRRALKQRYAGPYVVKEATGVTALIKNAVTGETRKAHFRHLEHLPDIPTTIIHPDTILKADPTRTRPPEKP